MSHLNFRGTMLVLAGALSLAACGSPDSPAQQGAALPQQAAPLPAPATPAGTPAPAASPAASQPAAGLREFIDPATGQSRAPTDVELKALAAATPTVKPNAAATPKPKEIVLSNGMIAVEAPGGLSDMKGCLQQDGRIVTDHDCKGAASAPVKKP